ncbi:hypothetical protein Sjap_021789 [Stephania japonica]|uniref:Uncharacterized protein n=1 Tax=Stephania japonica TaxID=461633 RepID=A0AAP0EQS6_9MAGN
MPVTPVICALFANLSAVRDACHARYSRTVRCRAQFTMSVMPISCNTVANLSVVACLFEDFVRDHLHPFAAIWCPYAESSLYSVQIPFKVNLISCLKEEERVEQARKKGQSRRRRDLKIKGIETLNPKGDLREDQRNRNTIDQTD